MSRPRDLRRVSALILSLWLALSQHSAAQDPLPAVHRDDPDIDPPGFHLLLRKPADKPSYRLGEKIELEFACVSEVPGQHFADCSPQLDIVPLDYGAETAVDPIETEWIDGVLCPGRLLTCGVGRGIPGYYPVGTDMHWQTLSIEKRYPLSAGRFRIVASVWGSEGEGNAFRVTSAPINIDVTDDPVWRAQMMARARELSHQDSDAYELVSLFPDTDAMRWLLAEQGFQDSGLNYVSLQAKPAIEMHPDRRAMAKLLRERLQDEIDGDSLGTEIADILAMNLAAENPDLYQRATKYKLSPGEEKQIRRWLVPLRRQLLLEVGESLVRNSEELRRRASADDSDEDADEVSDLEDLNSKAEVLVELSIPLCPNEYRGVLTKGELKHFMLQSGLTPDFIAEQLRRIPARQKPARKK